MAIDIPTTEPVSFYAGDTVKWVKFLEGYKSSDKWVLGYALISPSTKKLLTAVSYNDGYLINISTTTTAAYPPGKYHWQSYVTKAKEKYTIASGWLEVKTNYSSKTSYDARSEIQKIFEALEAAILGKATDNQLSRRVGDREIRYLSPKELLELRNFYKNEYNKELGKGGIPKNIKIGFSNE